MCFRLLYYFTLITAKMIEKSPLGVIDGLSPELPCIDWLSCDFQLAFCIEGVEGNQSQPPLLSHPTVAEQLPLSAIDEKPVKSEYQPPPHSISPKIGKRDWSIMISVQDQTTNHRTTTTKKPPQITKQQINDNDNRKHQTTGDAAATTRAEAVATTTAKSKS